MPASFSSSSSSSSVSIIDKTKYTGDLVLSAVSGLGAQALTDKQRAITEEALAQLAAGKPFTPHVIAYRGLLDEDIDPGTNGSIGLAILHQMDHYPKSAPLDLSCCGKQLDGGGGGVGRTNEHREDAEMRSIFDKASPGEYDPEANGEVTRENLIAALPAAMRAVVTDAMFDALDEDKTGTFSFEEVSLLLARCNDEGEVEQMRLLFNRMDTDESGTITAEELKTVLPVSVSEEHVDALVEEFDTNGDGLFTFNEVKGMFPRLRELGAGSLPIPYCQALLHPIESLKSTSMEMAQYFLSLRFICFMYCTMCIFGAALIACNWVINDNLIQYRVLLNDTALPAIIGTLPYTSSFPSVFLASYSYQSFFERDKMFPTIPDDAWNLLATAEIIHTLITVVILCFLVWALGALNDQIRGSEELLDKGVTSCSDFTLEVTCIPPSATAMQLGHVFRRWGEVAKVTLHFPIRSSLVDHTNVISQSVTNLRYAQRKDDIVANITSNGKHLKVPHQTSILAMAENKTLQEIDTAKEKETIAEELAETMAAVVKGGKPKPLTNAPTPFATAFVSFMHEADRSECEKSFADSTSINWSVFLGLEKPPQVLGEDGSDLNTNPYLFDQRWSHGLGMTPAHWRGEWSRYFRERLKGPGRKVFSRPEWFGVFIPIGTNDTDDILNLLPDASSGHTRCSTLQFICAQRVKLFCGCTLRVKRAPEPKDIRWKNIHIATCSKFLRYLVLITVLTTFCGLVSLLSAAYIVVSGFGDKMKENNFIRRTFSSFSPTFNQFLFNIAPLAISQLNLVTKLIGTKALVPALSNYIRHRSESAFTATVLVCTFAVETMQTAFLITASFVLATMSSRPYSDGDLAGEDSTPVPLIDAQTGNNVMQALGYYLFIVCVNSAFALMLMDSPGMLPVWIGRLVGTLPKITTCLGCKCLKEPQQYELDNKWRAPSSPIHIWTSKLAGSLVAVCAVGPWYPLMYFGAAFQVTTMLLCELWALLRLHSKPDPRGFEVAHISAMIYRACLGICFVSTLYFNWLMAGATKGGAKVKFWIPILIVLSIWLLAAVVTPLVVRTIPRQIRFLLQKDEQLVEASAHVGGSKAGSDSNSTSSAKVMPESSVAVEGAAKEDMLTLLLGKDPDAEKTWTDVESELLMADDSDRLNESGFIKTRGAHHPLKLEPSEAISRPDLHAYAPFGVLLPSAAMQVGHNTTAEMESGVDDKGFVIDLVGIQVWELGKRPTNPAYWSTLPSVVEEGGAEQQPVADGSPTIKTLVRM